MKRVFLSLFAVCGVALLGLFQNCTNGLGANSPAGVAALQAPTGVTKISNYNWLNSNWSACSATCSGGSQTRTVQCTDSSSNVVADSFCSSSKPALSQSCSTTCQAGTYSMNANGLVSTFTISSVSSSGAFSGVITNSVATTSISGTCLNGTIGFFDGDVYSGSYTSNNSISGLFTYAGVPYPWSATLNANVTSPCTQGQVTACSDSAGTGSQTCSAQQMYGSCVMNSCASGFTLSNGICVSQKATAKVVLVMGQSNAMNFGTVTQSGTILPFPGGWPDDPGIQIWNGSAFVKYIPGNNSNGDGDSAGQTWGPEAEYSRQRRLLNPGETIYIVKHAIGGTGLAQNPVGKDWSPYSDRSSGADDWSPYSDSTKEFQQMLTSLIGAANTLNGLGLRTVIDTALIVNGETDTLLMADANAFQDNLQMLLTATRGSVQAPNMRAIMNRPFPNSTQGPYLSTVRNAIQTVGGYNRNAWVNSDGLTTTSLPTSPNDGHLIPPSVVTLGARMFAADQATCGGQ